MSRRRKSQDESTTQYTLPDGMPYTLTIREVSKILQCSVNGCYEAARRGEIPTIRIGRRIVVPTVALMAMLGDQSPVGAEVGGHDE